MDFESLGAAIAILSKADPVAALATGVLSGILGKIFFDKKKASKKEKQANKKIINKIISIKEKQDATGDKQITE